MKLQTIEDAAFDILNRDMGDLPPPPWQEIGSGVWGTVYDLGDGTVLKIVRKRGGLGSAASILLREATALGLFNKADIKSIVFPELLGHGDLELPANPLISPVEGWLRLTKLNARQLQHHVPANPDARQRLGERLGAALATFHDETRPIGTDLPAALSDPISRSLKLLKDGLSKPDYKHLCEQLLMRWETLTDKGLLLHGDVNFSNLLIQEDEQFALVDFAESGVGVPCAEFRHLEQRPELRDAIFWGYQAASGERIDQETYYLAATANALASYYFGGRGTPGVAANDPRKGMRLHGMIRHCAERAGLEVA